MRSILKTSLFVLLLPAFMHAEDIKEKYMDTALRIISEALADSTAYERLAYICDSFGPRLSGSTNLEDAISWIMKEMRKDGIENVKGERVKVPAWIRGDESISILKPYKRGLTMLGLGGSVATPKAGIVAELMVVNDFEELERRSNEAKGKIVLFNAPFTTYGETVRYRYSGASKAAKHGAVASLVRSIGDWSMDTPHTGVMAYDNNYKKIPHAALTMEDAMMLGRMHDRGQKVTLKMKMDGRMAGDRWSKNVIGEIVGSTYPDEIVVVGAHIDSWDVGHGAHDDAGGCVAAWETLRLLNRLGLKPKRTIRCVMWTNEENGGRGNKAYRDMHMDELDSHEFANESDAGVLAPEGCGFTGSQEAKKIVEEIHELMITIKANNLTDGGRAPDIGILNDEGIPVMSLKVDNSKYFWYHHTPADTFDKVDFHEFNKCVAAMTIMSFVIADLDEPLPR